MQKDDEWGGVSNLTCTSSNKRADEKPTHPGRASSRGGRITPSFSILQKDLVIAQTGVFVSFVLSRACFFGPFPFLWANGQPSHIPKERHPKSRTKKLLFPHFNISSLILDPISLRTSTSSSPSSPSTSFTPSCHEPLALFRRWPYERKVHGYRLIEQFGIVSAGDCGFGFSLSWVFDQCVAL